MEKESDRCLPFLDVYIDNNSQEVITSIYRKRTFTGLLTNFFSFTSFSYKLGLIKTLIDRIYKVNNTRLGCRKDLKNLTHILKRNSFPARVIENSINNYINKTSNNSETLNSDTGNVNVITNYFKLPYTGYFSSIVKKRIKRLVNIYCRNLNVQIVFSSFKIGSWFSAKDLIPSGLRSRVVYKFSCVGCNACYIGETSRHLSTRMIEHLTVIRSLTSTSIFLSHLIAVH